MKINPLLFSTFVLSINSYAQEHEHPVGVLNKAPVVLSGMSSLEEFKESFEANGATLGAELIGFHSQKVEENAQALVYKTQEAARLKEAKYNCHYHRDADGDVEDSHCETNGESEARDYTAAEGSFSAAEFKKAAESSVSLFERALGDPQKIEEAKFWRSKVANQSNIQVKFVWKKDDGTQATNFMYCHHHQHGDEVELDCHRQREAGPSQP